MSEGAKGNKVTPDESPPSSVIRRWKFGLRTMLLVVAVLGLAIPLIVQSRRLEQAEAVVRKLRDETGRLSIDDRSKVHVMLVGRGKDPLNWKWRLFIPKGARYGWSLGYGDITEKQLPKPKINTYWNDPYYENENEVLVTVSLTKRDDGDWELSVASRIGDSKAQMGGTSVKVPDAVVKQTFGCLVGDALGANSTQVLDPGKPIVLLRYRACGKLSNGDKGHTEQPTAGYVVWMTPVP